MQGEHWWLSLQIYAHRWFSRVPGLAKDEGGRGKYLKSAEYRCGSRQPSPTAVILMQNTQIPENI